MLALLLKAAMPMLASASAHAQGRALVEICTVYGVVTVLANGADAQSAPRAPDQNHDHDDGAAHGAQHCALTALLAWSTPEPQALVWRITPRPADRVTWHKAPAPPPTADACAAWVAQLRHGPPAVA